MSLSFFIGKRYVTASRGKGFVSFISVVSVLGIAMGIIALVVVLSVMNGITGEVRDRLLSMTAHAKIIGTGQYHQALPKTTDVKPLLNNQDSIIGHAPFVEGQALIGVGQEYNGIQVKGIDPEQELNVADALANMHTELNTLLPKRYNVIIGKALAEKIDARIGEKITVIVPKTTVSAAGLLPRVKRFTVSAIFDSGHYLYDSGLVLINIDDAATLFQRGKTVDGFQLKLDDLFAAQPLVETLNKEMPSGLYAYDWSYENKAYFNAVKTEKAAMFMILMIIVMVAAFNILSTLVMVVTDKQRDIAILRTLGASPNLVMRVFMIQGTMLGAFGTVIGVAGGVLISRQVPNLMAFMESQFGFRLPQELYFIANLNPRIDASVVVLIAALSLLLSFLATLYPAFKAARLSPARALAYE